MIPLILAQSTPAATELASWLSVLFYLGGFIATVIGGAVGIKSLREGPVVPPQPFVVQEHQGMVGRGDIDQIHGRIKRERMELDEALKQLREEDKVLRLQLDTKISELEDRIDGVPERTINLLRSTKGLIT